MTTYLNKNHRFLRPLDGRSAFVNVIAREIGCYVELTHHRDNPIAMSKINEKEKKKKNHRTLKFKPPSLFLAKTTNTSYSNILVQSTFCFNDHQSV